MLESCCTSFQIHYQVGAEEFALLYNLAQAMTAPLLTAAANAPLLLYICLDGGLGQRKKALTGQGIPCTVGRLSNRVCPPF
jgi:hypothetical protein